MAESAVKKSNEANHKALRQVGARVIEFRPKKPEELEVEKANGTDGEPGKSQALPDDPFVALQEQGRVIEPPFDLLVLATLTEHSTELGQCIEAMTVNIDGTGHRYVSRLKLDDLKPVTPAEEKRGKSGTEPDKSQPKLTPEQQSILNAADEEKVLLTNFFEYATEESFVEFRERLRTDLETTGNAYVEVLRAPGGKITAFNHVPSYQMRLGRLDEESNLVTRKVLELQNDGRVEVKERKDWRRFRRYVQSRAIHLRRLSSIGGHKVRWFKEFGDPRVLHKETGEFENTEGTGELVKTDDHATELLHLKLYSARSPYGLPRFIGNLLSVYGDRAAEEINYVTFRNNNIPSMVVAVSNGLLTEGTIERIQSFVESQVQGSDNYSKFLIIEAEPAAEEGEDGGQVKIEITPLTTSQHNDALFQEYSKNNQDKIRRAFRLPPIFVGKCHSSDTEYLTRDGWRVFEQVPEDVEVGTFNASTGALEFQTPSKRWSYDYDGELLHLKNRGVDALVTPNHRMWTRPTVARSRSVKPWRFTQAGDLEKLRGGNAGYLEFPVSASWEGEEKESFEIPRNEGESSWRPGMPTKNPARDRERYDRREGWSADMSVFARFLGYFISEGSTTKTPGPITLSQNSGEVADDMVKIIRAMGFEPTIVESRPGQKNICFCHGGMWTWLRENCGHGSSEKQFPKWFLDCTQEILAEALETLVSGDGSIPDLGSEGAFTYSTTSRVLNDQMHRICLSLGFAYTSKRTEREAGWSDIYVGYAHKDKRHLLHPKKHIQSVPYTGKVSCFTVPNGLLVTRRNGRVLISSNSDDYTRATAESSRRLADEQIFSPEREKFDRWVNRFLFPEMGIVYHKFKSNSPNTTDNTQLVKILQTAEKTGGMTPRIARQILEDVLAIDLPEFPESFPADEPFSLTMAEAVKNEGDPAEVGQSVTALKALGILGDDGEVGTEVDGDTTGKVVTKLMALQKGAELLWRSQQNAVR